MPELGRGLVDPEELEVHPLGRDPELRQHRARLGQHAERAAEPDVVHVADGHDEGEQVAQPVAVEPAREQLDVARLPDSTWTRSSRSWWASLRSASSSANITELVVRLP